MDGQLITFLSLLSVVLGILGFFSPKSKYRTPLFLLAIVSACVLIWYVAGNESSNSASLMKHNSLKVAECDINERNFIEFSGPCILYPYGEEYRAAKIGVIAKDLVYSSEWDTEGGTRSFEIPLEENFYDAIVSIQYYRIANDLLIVLETGSVEGGSVIIYYLEEFDRVKWRKQIGALNVGNGVVEAGHLYLTWINNAMKLNLESGQFAWVVSDLEKISKTIKANSMEIISLNDRNLVVQDWNTKTKIYFDKSNGNILKFK